MQSSGLVVLALCFVRFVSCQLEIDVEGGSVNINSGPGIQIHSTGSHVSAFGWGIRNGSPGDCDRNISIEAKKTIDGCAAGQTEDHVRDCASDLVKRLCECYPSYRWYAEMYIIAGTQRMKCLCDYCKYGPRANGFWYYIAGQKSACANLPAFKSCDFNSECAEMRRRGACYCSKVYRPVWADWSACSNPNCGSHLVCPAHVMYAFS